MAATTKQATSASMALFYITVGALMDVWTIIRYIYLSRRVDVSDTSYLWCHGFLMTGIVLMVIGFAVGRIGRSARQAEVASVQVPGGQPVVTTPPAPMPTNVPVNGAVV